MLNKKAQVGESLTWMIATIIIIVILIIFVYASSILSVKTLVVKLKITSLDKNSNNNLISAKNELAFQKDSDNEKLIRDWIKEVLAKNE